jgi:hypothetical protein
MKKIIILFLLSLVVSACQYKAPNLKSPCVSADGPCARRPANAHWLS